MTSDVGSEGADSPQLRLVGSDRVRVEFMIDDLIRKIKIEDFRSIANCNGCNHCAAVADTPGADR
jgi:hypothetical protein